jgi:hypothetical protein
MISDVAWLQAWYRSHGDGEWEPSFGVEIQTVDNRDGKFEGAGDPSKLGPILWTFREWVTEWDVARERR